MSPNCTEWPSDTENITRVTNSTANPLTVEWLDMGLKLLFVIVGSLGNGLVIWVLSFRMKRGNFLTYVLNLAVADCGFCFQSSFEIPNLLAGGNYLYGIWFCRVDQYLTRVYFYAGTFLIACICVERCLAIRHPIWYKCRRPTWVPPVLCTVAWVVSLAMSIAIPFSLHIHHPPGKPRQCLIRSLTVILVLSTMELVLAFLLPLCVIVTANCIIFHKMVKDHLKDDKRSHVNRTVCATTILFLLCWAPFQTAQYLFLIKIKFLKENNGLEAFARVLGNYSSYLLYLNSCLNPFIYLWMGSEMKKRIMVSIPCLQGVFERAFNESTGEALSTSNSISA